MTSNNRYNFGYYSASQKLYTIAHACVCTKLILVKSKGNKTSQKVYKQK